MRERPARVEGQRREHRKNDLREVALARLQLPGVELVVGQDVDAFLGERRLQLLFQALVRGVHQALDFAADGDQLRARAHAVRAEFRDAGVQLRIEAGHADHEELVQVRADDGEEA